MTRPRLTAELLRPMAAPCPSVARCEVSEWIEGRRNVVVNTNKPVVNNTAA